MHDSGSCCSVAAVAILTPLIILTRASPHAVKMCGGSHAQAPTRAWQGNHRPRKKEVVHDHGALAA